jgi:hypothetical protein
MGATNWIPIGKPALLQARGTVIAGWPVTLNSWVWA